MYSGFPTECSTEGDKTNFANNINKGMGWNNSKNQISAEQIEDNISLRTFYKLLSNSLLGKLGQCVSTKKSLVTVTNQKSLNDLFYNETLQIDDFISMSPYVTECAVSSKTGFNAVNLRGNCGIAGHVSAYGRIVMDRAFRFLLSHNIKLLYSDTDSIYCILKKDQELPLQLGYCYHQFKDELPNAEIESFFALGPKIYQITYRDKITKKVSTDTKVKGFFLKSAKGREIVHDRLFSKFVSDYLKGVQSEAKIGQFQIKTTKLRQLKSVISQKVLKNSLFNKRVSFVGLEEANLFTLPFGYTESMHQKLFS